VPAINSGVLLLPDDVDVNQGFQQITPIVDPAAAVDPTYKTTSTFYEVVSAVFFQMVTDATAGSRIAVIVFFDVNARNLGTIVAPASQGPGTTVNYTFAIGLTTEGFVGGGVQTIELVEYLLFPGSVVTWGQLGGAVGAGDKVINSTMTLQRYGSGTAPKAVQPVSTPLLL
jgi:hypothetical protein